MENIERDQSERKFQDLFENSRDALMTLEPPSWMFTSGNPAAVKMFEAKDEADFVSREPWDLSPEHQPDGSESAVKAKEIIEIAMREGVHFFEWVHRRIGGEVFFADVLLTRLERDGKMMLQATVRDISDRKKMESQLKDEIHDMEVLLDAAMGREEKMIELKARIKDLEEKLGEEK